MSATRLFVLGTLARYGPMHGHQIRLFAEGREHERWTQVKHGSIYSALHRMQSEGLLRVERTERPGNLPARTIYAITEAGRAELVRHRDRALRDAALAPDPVELALIHAQDMDPAELLRTLQARRDDLLDQLDQVARIEAENDPRISPMGRLSIEHGLMRLRTEVLWHTRLIDELGPARSDTDSAETPANREPRHDALEHSRTRHQHG